MSGLIKGLVAAPCIVKKLLLGGIELADFFYFLGSNQEQLCNGSGGGYSVTVHPMNLEGSGHALQLLVGQQNLLVAEENSSRVFH